MTYITWEKNKSDITQWESPTQILLDRGCGLISVVSENDNSVIATLENEIDLNFSNLWSVRKLTADEIAALSK